MKPVSSKLFILSIVTIFSLILTSCHRIAGSDAAPGKTMLWNGKDLSGWKVIPEGADSQQTWSVRNDVIYCTGKPNGYLRTEKQYADYHLHVEWRWPENPANSGVLLHAAEPDNVWPKTIECQLQAGNAGNPVLMNGTGITVNGEKIQNPSRQFVQITKKEQSSEKPQGQWNSYDIYCQGDSIRCYVNDVLQNEGTAVTQSTGWICLQSEGGQIEFRNIYIEPSSKAL
jgi:hypothetical protein